MKIFIWLATFFIIVGIPNALIVEFCDIKFGAIPTMILAGAAYWTAKALCKKWDNHKNRKKEGQTDTESESTSSDQYMQEEPTTSAITPNSEEITIPSAASNTKEQKTQYIKIQFKKTTALIATLCILLCASIGINIYQTFKNTQHQNNINTLSEELEIAQKNCKYYANRFSSASSERKKLQREITNLESTLSFYEEHVVIVPNNNTYTYHIYGCKYCDTSYGFWIYNYNAAQDKGYSPCKYCCD